MRSIVCSSKYAFVNRRQKMKTIITVNYFKIKDNLEAFLINCSES